MSDDWPLLTPPPGGRDQLSDLLAERLLAQRVVLLHGPLEDLTVARVSAELMTLDAEGDDPVTLRVDCGDAELAPALTLMDVVELMGVPVRALCLGQVGRGCRGRGGGVCGPGRNAEHPLRPARTFGRPGHDARTQRGPVGRAQGRRTGALLRSGGGGREATGRTGAPGPRARPLPQRSRGGRVRADRRGVPPRCGHTPVARFGAAADGVPSRALISRHAVQALRTIPSWPRPPPRPASSRCPARRGTTS